MRHRMIATLALAVGIGLALAAPRPASAGDSFEAALKKAKETNTPILVAITASSWNPPCKKMHKETFPSPEVKKAMEAFVVVMLDMDADGEEVEKVAAHTKVAAGESLPDVRVLTPDGRQVVQSTKFLKPEDFILWLEKAAEKAKKG